MRLCSKLAISAFVLLLPCTSAYPAELAILRNGFAISYERRETRNKVTRLYLTGTSDDYVDVPTGQIVRFQVEDLDLPEIPIPSVAPAVTLGEVISAASARKRPDSPRESKGLNHNKFEGKPAHSENTARTS